MKKEGFDYYISNLKIRSDSKGRKYSVFVINGIDFMICISGFTEKEEKEIAEMQIFPNDDTFIDFYNNTFKGLLYTCLTNYLCINRDFRYTVFNSTMEYLMGPCKKEHILEYYKMLRTSLKFL